METKELPILLTQKLPIVTLCVRTWMRQGSTYHTLRIVDSESCYDMVLPYEYGHGLHAYILRAAKVLNVSNYGQVEWIIDEAKVSRRKDMHLEGRLPK